MKVYIGSTDLADELNECVEESSHLFIQYSCKLNDVMLKDKYDHVSLLVATIMLIAFCFIVLIYYMQRTSKLDQLAYDMNTITAGDFTVELDINNTQWKKFLTEIYTDEIKENYSQALYFKHYLKEQIENLVEIPVDENAQKNKKNKKKRNKVKSEDDVEQKEHNVKVHDINLAFNN